MTLEHLAREYRASAAQLAPRIQTLRRQLRGADEAGAARVLRRLKPLEDMYYDTLAMAGRLEHYYRSATVAAG